MPGESWYIFHYSSGWYISNDLMNYQENSYYEIISGASEPPLSGWSDVFGDAPAPTLVYSPCISSSSSSSSSSTSFSSSSSSSYSSTSSSSASLAWTANNGILSTRDGDMAAYWKAEDLTDSISTWDLTNVNSSTFTTGKYNNALTFDGTDQYTYASWGVDYFLSAQEFTISCWIKPDVLESVHIMGHGVTTFSWFLQTTSDGNVNFVMSENGSSYNLILNSTDTPIGTSSFHHIVVTRVGNLSTLYVDNDVKEAVSQSYTMFSSSVNLHIGAGQISGTPSLFFDGKIDEIGFWIGYGFTTDEVSALYNSGTGSFLISPLSSSSSSSSSSSNSSSSTSISSSTSTSSSSSSTEPYVFQGTNYGYTSGGEGSGATGVNTIDKFTFASDNNATDVGDLVYTLLNLAGQSSRDNGYVTGGGSDGSAAVYNYIQKFSFAIDGNATDVANLTQAREGGVGQSTGDYGYTSGGYYNGNKYNTIDKFTFASDNNATNVGDLTETGWLAAGQSSTDYGYTSGGDRASSLNRIDKFSFSSDGNATDVGDLSVGRQGASGQSSTDYGYSSGGWTGVYSNVIDKFTFASDNNATDVGDLTNSIRYSAGQSSTTYGYRTGGDGTVNIIDKLTFASDNNATDVGDLTVGRGHCAGQQY